MILVLADQGRNLNRVTELNKNDENSFNDFKFKATRDEE